MWYRQTVEKALRDCEPEGELPGFSLDRCLPWTVRLKSGEGGEMNTPEHVAHLPIVRGK
jgi:hypothetical protein